MLEARDIHKSYHNGNKAIQVLKGVDLKIAGGEFAAIVGPSGAGKTTLLNILGGLDLPTRGEVFFAGEDLYSLADNELCRLRNKKIGFVFQFYHLLSEFTVLENVSLPALIGSSGPKQRKIFISQAEELLVSMGLENRITHLPSQLSGGEKQRVAIARALINQPELLLCDEPTGNLDTRTGSEIISLVKKISSQRHMSVVVVTHNAELAASADKLFHLKDGIILN